MALASFVLSAVAFALICLAEDSEVQEMGGIPRIPSFGDWELIKPLGEGGQSKVDLVRSPERAAERASCLSAIRSALDGDKRAELAEAIWTYARPDSRSELGARKVFKIPAEGSRFRPPPGSEDHEAVDRLKNEIIVLKQNRFGLPKLLDSNEDDR